MNKNWYAVYTRPQCEKKVVAQLSRKRIESFAPVNNCYLNGGGRKKSVIEPLFPCFVFVNISDADITTVRQTSDVINFVYWLGKPAVIKTTEIENIFHFSNNYHNIILAKIPVNVNGIVQISNTPKIDVRQDIVSTTRNTIKITLPSLGYMMQAEAAIGNEEAVTSKVKRINLVN